MTDHNDTGATARPWKIDPRPFRNHGLIHISNGEYIVAKALGQTVTCETEAEATAALIVEAVNAYEPLKARLAEVAGQRNELASKLSHLVDSLKHAEARALDAEARWAKLTKVLKRIAHPSELAADPMNFGKFPEAYLKFAQEIARTALAAEQKEAGK